MLPLRHTNRTNDSNDAPGLSLQRKSSRPSMSCKQLPYNGSASYYINSPPPYLEYPQMPAPPPPQQFRQRPRPAALQFFDQDSNRLSVPLHRPKTPCSPLLSQVLTSSRTSGPTVLFMVERKREKTRVPYKKMLVALLVIVGIWMVYCGVYNVFGRLQDFIDDHQSKVETGEVPRRYESPVVGKIILDDERGLPISEYSKTDPVPSGGTLGTKIIYSINDDFEATVENA